MKIEILDEFRYKNPIEKSSLERLAECYSLKLVGLRASQWSRKLEAIVVRGIRRLKLSGSLCNGDLNFANSV